MCKACQTKLRLIARLRKAVAAEASGGEGMTDRAIMRALSDADRMLGRPKVRRSIGSKKTVPMSELFNAKPRAFGAPALRPAP